LSDSVITFKSWFALNHSKRSCSRAVSAQNHRIYKTVYKGRHLRGVVVESLVLSDDGDDDDGDDDDEAC